MEARYDMAEEMAGHWVGPMPNNEFFARYMPIDGEVPKDLVAKNFFQSIPRDKTETAMYQPLIEHIRKAGLMGDKYVLLNTSDGPDKNSQQHKKWKPDIIARKAKDEKEAQDKTNDEKKHNVAFEEVQLAFEIKPDNDSPFVDPPEEGMTEPLLREHAFEKAGVEPHSYRGQMALVLAEICARQYRTHAFMVFMNKTEARFLRADRSGTIVTRAFNYRTNSQVLAEFLYRFARLSDSDLGIDTSVRLATKEEKALAVPHLSKYLPVTVLDEARPFFALCVPAEDGSSRTVIGRDSLAEPDSLTGRATRAFHVFDLKAKKVMFLKDTWRTKLEGMENESDILKELWAAGVPRIPKIADGGDVIGPYHETQSQTHVNANWRAGPLASLEPRAHNRLLQDFLGIHLSKFTTPKQLMTVIADAFEAHTQALVVRGILHRDVSEDNVMIDENGRGILNDWDLAKRIWIPGSDVLPKDDLARHSYRTGTWLFISGRLLIDPFRLHTLQDDLESFFHLVLYYALRYLPHNLGLLNLKVLIDQLFLEYEWNEVIRQYVGGKGKFLMILDGFSSLNVRFMDNKPLAKWLRDALGCLTEFYQYCINMASQITEDQDDEPLPSDESLRVPPSRLVPPPPATIRLHNHDHFVSLFKTALATPGWPSKRTNLGDQLDALPRGSKRKPTADEEEDSIPDPESPLQKKRKPLAVSLPPPRPPTRSSQRIKELQAKARKAGTSMGLLSFF
ncbi:hypothetical protein NLJ89_g7876 [Agrocybe chaxingu]|uniref:Protein kinase domain-containing protein n=1 Tax=Agrocybe chaxingu TaxID=84603 RepID=A0A9W8JTP1_9AGAR|nr:hypothetical protein NLJ89_g7876 [Agrocybe chaxingu]